MPEYLRPGVYMEEFDSGPNSIEGVSTSTASFVGPTERGPVNPRLITNFPQFLRVFGTYLPDSNLTYCVQGFFANGGKRCWVSRIVSKNHWDKWKDGHTFQESGQNKKTMVGRALMFDKRFNFTEIRSIGPGTWFEDLTIKVSKGTNLEDDPNYFKISVHYKNRNNSDEGIGPEIEVFDDLSSDETSSRFYQKVINGNSNYIELFPFHPKTTGADNLQPGANLEEISVRTALRTIIEDKHKGATNLDNDSQNTIRWQRFTASGSDPKEFLALKKGNNTVVKLTVKEAIGANGSVWAEYTKNSTTSFNIHIKKFASEITDPFKAKYLKADEESYYYDMNNSGDDEDDFDENHFVNKMKNDLIVDATKDGQDEFIPDLSAGTHIDFFKLMETGYSIKLVGNPTTSEYKISPTDYTGSEYTAKDNEENVVKTYSTGLLGLGNIKDISIVCATEEDEDNSEQISRKVIEHCEVLRDRFAVYQPPKAQININNIARVKKFGDFKYAAIYAPWVNVLDPITDRPRLIPPSGHVAGVYARTDINRGVHKAPANESLLGIYDLPVSISDGLQESLNPINVNLIRTFEGRGTLVWGARTNSNNPKWKYINVRRLFIAVSKSIYKSTQGFVFEPNNRKLWSTIRSTINQYLFGIWRTGALMGANPEDAYFVQCDRTTMTEDDIQNGRLVCVIGLATTKPAEFVIFRLTQTREGATFEEINQ